MKLRHVVSWIVAAVGCAQDDATQQVACPAIACRNGAIIRADLPFTFERAKQLTFELCYEDYCEHGQLSATAELPTGLPRDNGVGFLVPPPQEGVEPINGHGDVSFLSDGAGGVYLQLEWTPWQDSDLKSGDRVRLTATDPSSAPQTLIDTMLDYQLNKIGFESLMPERPGPCAQTCHFAELDLRTS
jgi:hypothetical protein